MLYKQALVFVDLLISNIDWVVKTNSVQAFLPITLFIVNGRKINVDFFVVKKITYFW